MNAKICIADTAIVNLIIFGNFFINIYDQIYKGINVTIFDVITLNRNDLGSIKLPIKGNKAAPNIVHGRPSKQFDPNTAIP